MAAHSADRQKQTRVFDTRIDRCRARLRLLPGEWAAAADVGRGQLLRYRTGDGEPRSRTLARLVRGAADVTGKPVRAADFYDLGDDEPLGPPVAPAVCRGMKRYRTRVDEVLQRYGFPPSLVAAWSGKNHRTITLIRRAQCEPKVSTITTLVRTLRRMGADIHATDLFDLGERSCSTITRGR